jgi:putative ABC transport system ATP-binding protein
VFAKTSGSPVEAVVSCERVWKIFRSSAEIVKAVQDVSLEVKQGEFLCVRGPSGSGKSTLLTILGALEPPTKGEVSALGLRYGALSSYELSRFRRLRVGFVFQELSLIPHLTASENVIAPRLFDGVGKRRLTTIADDLLRRVGLENRSRHYPRQLSYGERQRIALARAIVNDPKILIADEPTANLDPANVERIVTILNELCSRGTAVIVATHDVRLEQAADRVLGMSNGMLTGNSTS